MGARRWWSRTSPGGNGVVAARQAARAASDGHGLFLATNATHAASVHLTREPGYEFVSWVAVFLPAQSPAAAQARLNWEIRAILEGEEGRRFSLGIGLVPATSSPEELAQFQAREIALWGRIAQAANLPKE